jgi:hypothetical protein
VQKLNELLADGDEDGATESAAENFALPTRAFFDNEKLLLQTLLTQLRSLSRDSKWELCTQLLQQIEANEPDSKVLIFTQYRVTQSMLRDRLASLFPAGRVEIVHGEVDAQERRLARIRFENESRFLISTEAGGEGVNLQKACHVMVNYDLPWNPMRLQQRIGRLDRYGQRREVRVFNLRVPNSWDQQISTRIIERLEVIQRTMSLTGADLVEDYREMILGEIAEQIDATRLFSGSQSSGTINEEEVDEWVRGAVKSVDRWQKLFGPEFGMGDEATRLRPSLTGDDFKTAFRLGCEGNGIQLRETRNSTSQFVSGVFNFDLPPAFRDPLFRPSRTVHVAFDRNIYGLVRGQDLGVVRGQPIRPVLSGFGEPFTDWLFEAAMNARAAENAFILRSPDKWTYGTGWGLVYALRWIGPARRLATPDSLAVVFLPDNGQPNALIAREAALLIAGEGITGAPEVQFPPEGELLAKRCAQQVLRDTVSARAGNPRSTAGLSLLMIVRVEK